MKKEEKRQIPAIFSNGMYSSYIRTEERLKNISESTLKPALSRLGMCDDEHIRKYLLCESMEDIYKDIKEQSGNFSLCEQIAKSFGEDYWSIFRDTRCDVENPRLPGFSFKMLQTDSVSQNKKNTILKALTVKDGILFFDDDIIREACLLRPSQELIELYELVEKFCNDVNALNIKKRHINTLFRKEITGKLEPNLKGILGGGVISL